MSATRIREGDAEDTIQKGNALIEFYHHVDPSEMMEEEWAARVNGILWVLKLQREALWGKDKK